MKLLRRVHLPYFILTITIMVLIFGVTFLALAVLWSGLFRKDLSIISISPAMLPLSFAYGFFSTRFEKKSKRADTDIRSFFQTYLPFAIIFAANFLFDKYNALNNWHDMDYSFTLVLLFEVVGFAIGERIAAKIFDVKRPKLNYIKTAVFIVGCAAVAFAGTMLLDNLYEPPIYLHNEEEMDKYLNREVGYGFLYEQGWSSVNLYPYYVENEENLLIKLDNPSLTISDADKMPVLDGAEAAYPVYSAFALNCYEDIAQIQLTAKASEDISLPKPIRFTNTVEAFKSLVSGDIDIFFGAKPSEAQKKLAADSGKELVLKPIGKEAFVFFVSKDNPVDSLTSEQIRSIYSGKYKYWDKVGGSRTKILAYQRPENSGSQTMMQYFMGDTPLRKPLEVEFDYSMLGVLRSVADYSNSDASIGYSFRYYATKMTDDEITQNIKFISVDGVYPDENNIKNNSYPLTTELYAITLSDNPNENVVPFVEWMCGEQGNEIVSKTGYISP